MENFCVGILWELGLGLGPVQGKFPWFSADMVSILEHIF